MSLMNSKTSSYMTTVFLFDNNRLVRVLLDEVLTSTIARCVDPVMMEQSVSNLIVSIVYLSFYCRLLS